MKIIDNTPFRTESGQIDLFGRAQGVLKFGLSWFARLKAQDTVIAVLDKILDPHFVLLRNITLPDTEIDLPMVLIGPPGLYLINVTHDRGVYRARDDEWGTISGEKFVPAGINQVQRTIKMGRVLQLYLDHAGYKGTLAVEPLLLAADPGMHIESVRPAVRIVMSDALERFAISMNQARPIFNTIRINDIVHTILNGPNTPLPSTPAFISTPTETSANNHSDPLDTPQTDDSITIISPFENSDDLFDRLSEAGNPDFVASPTNNGVSHITEERYPESSLLSQVGEPADTKTASASNSKPAVNVKKKNNFLGMSKRQLWVLSIILIIWLLAMLAFSMYIYINFHA